jgi:hypothetical protein
VVEEFKKLWLPVGVDFVVVRVLSADHCKYSSLGKCVYFRKKSPQRNSKSDKII